MNNGLDNFNSTRVRFDCSGAPTGNTVITGSFAHPWFGLFTPTLNSTGLNVTRFEIRMNERTIYQHATTDSRRRNYIRSVFTHELCHALGLRDGFNGRPQGNGINGSIMNHDRDRNTIFRLTSFDISSIVMNY
jgi:hypothetical protein